MMNFKTNSNSKCTRSNCNHRFRTMPFG